MKRKAGKGSLRRPRKGGRFLFVLIAVGVGLALIFLYHRNVFHMLDTRRGPPKKEVLLFFSDRNGEYLVGEKRKISRKNKVEEEAKETVVELIKGPRKNLVPTLPPHTKLLTLRLDEQGVAKVNFNRSLSKDHPGGSSAEVMTAYSVVNSLTENFPEIERVQILVEGRPIETISGHLSLKRPLSPKPELIGKEGKE